MRVRSMFVLLSLCVLGAVLPSASAVTMRAEASYPVGAAPAAVVVGDLDRDGRADVVVANAGSDDVTVLRGDGAGGLAGAGTYAMGPQPVQVALGDLDRDGVLDLVTAGHGSHRVFYRLGDGRGRFRSLRYKSNGSTPPAALALTDLNADGRLDIVTGNPAAQTVSVLRGDGKGGFDAPASSPYSAAIAPDAIATGDVNGDGHIDVVVSGSAGVSVLLGVGTGRLGFASLRAVEEGAVSVRLARVDGDAYLDAVIGRRAPSDVAVLHGDGTGRFQGPATAYPVGGTPSALALADVDADRGTDVLTLAGEAGQLAVLLSDGAGALRASSRGPWPLDGTATALATSDLDGDGLADAVVTRSDGTLLVVRNTSTTGIDASPRSVDFGSRAVGTSSDERNVEVWGTGLPTGVATVSVDAGAFAVVRDGCSGRTLADSRASCVIGVRFAPSTAGHQEATLAVASDAGTIPIALAGEGTVVDDPPTSAPDTTITEHPGPLTNDTTPTLRFMSDSAGSSFVCSVDGSDLAPCASPHTLDELAEGEHTFSVAAVGTTGLVDPTPDTLRFEVDTTAPRTKITGPRRTIRRNARYVFRFSEDVARVLCSIDGSGYSDCRTPFSARALRVGKHVLRVRAVDRAGNVESPAATKRFRIVRG